MKKILIYCLLVCLCIALVSCDESMMNKISLALDKVGGNAYLDSNLIKVDTSEIPNLFVKIANAVINVEVVEKEEADGSKTYTQNIGSGKLFVELTKTVSPDKTESTSLSVGGTVVDTTKVSDGVKQALNSGFSSPYTPEGVKSLGASMIPILQSDKKKVAFIEELKKPAEKDAKEKAQGTFAVISCIADTISTLPVVNDKVKPIIQAVGTLASQNAENSNLSKSDAMSAELLMTVLDQVSKFPVPEEQRAESVSTVVDTAMLMVALTELEAGSFNLMAIDGATDLITALQEALKK